MGFKANASACVVVAIAAFAACLFRCQIHSVKTHFPKPHHVVENSRLTGAEQIGIGDLIGPEDVVRSTEKPNVLFAGLGDGRIVRLTHGEKDRWETVIRTGIDHPSCGTGGLSDSTNTEAICGRPMGMVPVRCRGIDKRTRDEECLVVADAYKGLLLIMGIHEESAYNETAIKVLSTRARTDKKGSKYNFLNGVAVITIGATGQYLVYMTDTSVEFQHRRMAFAALSGRKEGRLLAWHARGESKKGKYRVKNYANEVTTGIFMPNGLAVSHDNKNILVLSGVQILKYDKSSHRMDHHALTRILPGIGDSLVAMDHLPMSSQKKKCYWVALSSKYAAPRDHLHLLNKAPWVRWLIAALVPYGWIVDSRGKWGGIAVVGEDGKLIETLQDPTGETPWISSVTELGDYLYLGSWYNNFMGRIHESQIRTTKQ